MSETVGKRGWWVRVMKSQRLLVAGTARCAVTSRHTASVAARRAAIGRSVVAIGGAGGVGTANTLPRYRGCELLLDGLREGGTDGRLCSHDRELVGSDCLHDIALLVKLVLHADADLWIEGEEVSELHTVATHQLPLRHDCIALDDSGNQCWRNTNALGDFLSEVADI